LDKKTFDFNAFYSALSSTVAARDLTWKELSNLTGVSQSTLSRMQSGRQPDGASLTALAAWSGLNPVDFTGVSRSAPEPIAMVTKLLREDPQLDTNGVEAMEAIIQAAYARFRRDQK
jgi:transcriptional regulator with XRE-family HTH domain